MFTQFRNIDTAFRHIRTFSIALIAANVLTMGFCIYKSFQIVDSAHERIHILYNGKVLEAIASDRKTNLPVQLRDHIKTFHHYFFSLVPDEKAVQATVSKALYLADESAKKQYDNLRESGYYNNLISANISQEIEVDSIRLDIDSYPYGFTCYATQKLVRASSTATRRLVTQGRVRDLKTQTDNNPHGFLVQGWEILENRDLETKINR
ncbi:conjugative transposon protein TraK [Sphingobacterium cellulitidis]|uniref:conjugative transposon protein TraK n=1 Tax=Sphingobacterium cellulitidis TaxID=1768011 RepID=UPI000B940CB4|nr:conjugative transposon protein TraK [Sphingobacterium cellulitidis]OYD46373.1 conjugative transposon protein TraK [Sphingobacterium cellulitidis]